MHYKVSRWKVERFIKAKLINQDSFLRDMVNFYFPTIIVILENGMMEKCMGMVGFNGRMALIMMGNIGMAGKMVKGHLIFPQEIYTKDSGKMENNMEGEFYMIKIKFKSRVENGKREISRARRKNNDNKILCKYSD